MFNLLDILVEAKTQYCLTSKQALQHHLFRFSKSDNRFGYDWDFNSGEEWVTLFIDKKIIAYLCVSIPVIFLDNYYDFFFTDYFFLNNFMKPIIKDFDECIWYIDLVLYHKTIHELPWHASNDAINTCSFSVNDFWYATI